MTRQEKRKRLFKLEEERKALLKTYRGVIHEDASSEVKYVRLKVLENQIAYLKETLAEKD